MRRASRMRVCEKAMAGWSTKFWSGEVLQLLKTRSRDELQSERRDAEAVRHGLLKHRASLRACAKSGTSRYQPEIKLPCNFRVAEQ